MFLVVFIKSKPGYGCGWLSGEQIPLRSHPGEEGFYQYFIFQVRPCSHRLFPLLQRSFHRLVMVSHAGECFSLASGFASKLAAARWLSLLPRWGKATVLRLGCVSVSPGGLLIKSIAGFYPRGSDSGDWGGAGEFDFLTGSQGMQMLLVWSTPWERLESYGHSDSCLEFRPGELREEECTQLRRQRVKQSSLLPHLLCPSPEFQISASSLSSWSSL